MDNLNKRIYIQTRKCKKCGTLYQVILHKYVCNKHICEKTDEDDETYCEGCPAKEAAYEVTDGCPLCIGDDL